MNHYCRDDHIYSEFIEGVRRFIQYGPSYVDIYGFIDVVIFGSTYDDIYVSLTYTSISI